jgi:hypothetical protein
MNEEQQEQSQRSRINDRNPIRRYLEKRKERKEKLLEKIEVVDRLVDFLENGSHDWTNTTEYKRPGTGFEWWKNPHAEDSVIEVANYNTPFFKEPKYNPRPITDATMYYLVGKKDPRQAYPTVYELLIDKSERHTYNALDPKGKRQLVEKNISKKVFTHTEKEEAENLMLCDIDDTYPTRYSRLVKVWHKGKPESGRKPRKKTQISETPQYGQLEPIPIPVTD